MWRFFPYRDHPAGETCKGTRALKPLFLKHISDKRKSHWNYAKKILLYLLIIGQRHLKNRISHVIMRKCTYPGKEIKTNLNMFGQSLKMI